MFHLTFLGGTLLNGAAKLYWSGCHPPAQQLERELPTAAVAPPTGSGKQEDGSSPSDTGASGRAFSLTTLNNIDWEVPDDYTELRLVGVGAYGHVCAAIHRDTGETLAIKKLYRPLGSKLHGKRAHREIQLLMHLGSSESNVIRLIDVFTPNTSVEDFKDIYLVMEYMPTDLQRLIEAQTLAPPVYQLITYQVLRGLDYIHSAGVLHRDLKPSNISINEGLVVKILDFGMARVKSAGSEDCMTGYVVSRWYRAPEVMLNWEHYGNSGKVDTWSVGCVLAEMMSGQVLFKGLSEMDQIMLMVKLLGIPSPSMLKNVDDAARAYFESQPRHPVQPLEEHFPGCGSDVLDLLAGLLKLDAKYRFSTREALTHPFFKDVFDPADIVTAKPISTTDVDEQDLSLVQWKAQLFKEIKEAECILRKEGVVTCAP